MGVADLDKTGGPSASVVPEDRGRASGESANLLKEANEGSEKDSEAGPRDLEEATRTAQGAGSENNQKKGEEEEGGKEAPMEEAAGSKSSEKQPGEKEEPSADGEKTRGTGRNERESPEERPAPSKEEVAWVEEIPVNSIVLAAKSCVLRTMLSNGMKESDKSAPVVLKVTPEGETAAICWRLRNFRFSAVFDLHQSVVFLPDRECRTVSMKGRGE